MGPSNMSFLSFRVVFHFHDCGRKGSPRNSSQKQLPLSVQPPLTKERSETGIFLQDSGNCPRAKQSGCEHTRLTRSNMAKMCPRLGNEENGVENVPQSPRTHTHKKERVVAILSEIVMSHGNLRKSYTSTT